MARRETWPKDGLWSHRSKKQRDELAELLGPGHFFPCDHPWVTDGVVVPGRKGGTVKGCATPTTKAPKDAHVWVGDLALGAPLKVSTVRDRLRQKRDPSRRQVAAFDGADMALAVSLAVDEWRLYGVPAPVGRVHRGRPGSSRCDATHPLWSEYDEALAAADGLATARLGDPSKVSARTYREALREELEQLDPERFEDWDRATRACVSQYESHVPRNRGYESPQAEVARRRRDYLQTGGDVGHGDWTDYLSDATKARKKPKRSTKPRKKART
jgi:hypothetical protein